MNPMKKMLAPFAFALALAGCAATSLEPAATARPTPGSDEGAFAVSNGIHLIARAGAWDGTPEALSNQLTPIRVTLINEGSEPVRIAYNKFRLVSDKGRRYSAIPPFRIDGKIATDRGRLGSPFYPAMNFVYAPYLSTYWTGATGAFEPNAGYWNNYAPLLDPVNLPTDDMLRKALPEGILQPGGRVSGFLYFEGVGADADRVRLVADLQRARDRGLAARLAIPFDVS